jgi:cellobiose-specific phosphotransferase system component IIC
VLALRLIVEASPFGDINSMITTLIGIPMSHVGGSLPGMIISVILIGILWTLGLHGDTCAGVYSPGLAVEYVGKPGSVSEWAADPAYHHPAVL